MALSIGTRLGPYEITAPLGAGGMGEVYRARDTRLDRTVAVKILADGLAHAPGFKDRFEREARTVSSLNHPSICALYDVGSQDGTEFLVMEYLDGETLAARLQRRPMSLQECVRHAIELAGALDAAHRHGVVHRDLKPANIMLCKSGLKLMDFGLARDRRPRASADATIAATFTQEGSILGTPSYMAPEQVQGAEADARSDIFAFGATLYEMVTGARAFPGSNPHSIAAAILEKQPERIAALRPEVPAALEHLIALCLTKDPDERWQSAHDLELELKSILEIPNSVVRGSKRSGVTWALVAATLFFSATTIFLLLRSRHSDTAHAYRASLLPPPGTSFEPYNFALSPDGKRLAFVGIAEDGRDFLWVRALDGRLAQQFAATEGASFPFWAPDNRRVGFFAERHLKTLDTRSGAVNVIGDAPIGRGRTWNRLGTIVFAPSTVSPLLSVSESGGPAKRATPYDTQSGQADRWPWFLPDDDHFLYIQNWGTKQDRNLNGLYLGSVKTGQSKLLSSEVSDNVSFSSGQILFVQGRSLMAQDFNPGTGKLTGTPSTILNRELDATNTFGRVGVSVSSNGVAVFQPISDVASELLWLDRGGKEVGRIPESGSDSPALSPDSQLLAMSSDVTGNSVRVIRLVDLQRGIATQLTDGGAETTPVWSPDGSQIAYASLGVKVDQRPANGSGKAETLLQGFFRLAPTDYSPDGRFLTFTTFEKGPPYLAVYDRSRRNTALIVPGSNGQFSPDGKWLAYSGETDRVNVSVQPFPANGTKIQISSNGGAQPRWSRDGRSLFFIAPDRKLMEVTLTVEGGKLLAGLPRPLFQTRIIATSKTFFQYDVDRKNNRFLVNSIKPNAPLTLVTNWQATPEP